MKIYILQVSGTDSEWEQITECVVLANSESKAIVLAEKERQAEWFVIGEHDIDSPKVIQSYINHG